MKYKTEHKTEYNYKLLEHMKRQKLTQGDIAERTGLNLTSVHYIISGKVVPRTGSAIRIAKVFNKKVDELFKVD